MNLSEILSRKINAHYYSGWSVCWEGNRAIFSKESRREEVVFSTENFFQGNRFAYVKTKSEKFKIIPPKNPTVENILSSIPRNDWETTT